MTFSRLFLLPALLLSLQAADLQALSTPVIDYSLPTIVIDTIGPRADRVKKARQAFLTQEMDLTEVEAEAFFPIFWQREQERRDLLREARQERRRFTSEEAEADEDMAMRRLELLSDLQDKRGEIEDRYQALFLEVIPPTKLLKLEPAERAFRRRLLDRVRQGRPGRGGRN
ncbi:MAG: hypothetical protein AAGF87_03915 [Bacteroidota bacterium]